MIKKLSRVQSSNGNNHRYQKQFHTMLSALLKLGSAGLLPTVMVIIGFCVISSSAVAAESDEKAQLEIGSRLREALGTVKEVKGQDRNLLSEPAESQPVYTLKEDKGQALKNLISDSKISAPQQSIKLAEIGDTPVAPSPNSQSDSLFDRQGGSLLE